MGPKLMNSCMPEQVSTKEHGKMLKRIQILEDGRVPATESKNWNIAGQKKRTTRKEYQRLLNKFEMEDFKAQKRLLNLARNKALQDRGALGKKAMPSESRQCMKETS